MNLVFFFDENTPPRVAAALQVLGTCEARHHYDYLPRGTPDTEVFRFLAEKGWIWITHDRNIRRRAHELAALRQAGVAAFVLTGRVSRTVDQLAMFLIDAMPRIMRKAERLVPPYIVSVSDRLVLEVLVQGTQRPPRS